MAREEPRIVIALSAGGASPHGRIGVDGEPGRPFRGWLSLLAELGREVGGDERPLPATPTEPPTGAMPAEGS